MSNLPTGDGSKSLAPESKTGFSVMGIVFVILQGIQDGLTNLDLDGRQGWHWPFINLAVATGAGLIAAYLKKNRR